MSPVTLVTFLHISDSSWNFQDAFQNGRRELFNPLDDGSGSYVEQSSSTLSNAIKWGWDYWYLPFLYQGATKSRGGDNLEANLIFANNPVSMNRAREAVANKWTVEVIVTSTDPDMTYVKKILTHDVWIAASMAYDPTQIEVLLSSGIDAVGSNAPNRVLTTGLCGHLPTTGQIQNR
jgi:hypothetical protein